MAEYPNYQGGVPDGNATGVASIIGPGVEHLGQPLYIANSAGGNAEPLSTAVATAVAVAANVITVTGIPSNQGAHLKIIFVGTSTEAAETDTLTIQFNGDTAAHYDSTATQVSHATVSGVDLSAGADFATLATIPGASATAAVPGICIIDIPLFHGTAFMKAFQWQGGYSDIATAAADVVNSQGNGLWRSAAAITSFVLAAGTGHLAPGSLAYVYTQ